LSVGSRWPALPLTEWHETHDTLQLWTQIIGKVRMVNESPLNHWWNVPLYVSARGLTTSLVPHPSGEAFQIDFDLRSHRLDIVTASGGQRSQPLEAGPVAGFYSRIMGDLDELGIATEIWPMPVEIEDAIPFPADDVHRTYDPDHAHRFWLALVQIVPVLEQFRSRFVGKTSPVHLFWGGLDLATTRFSGRTAPPHPGGAPHCGPQVMHEAYSHEVSSCGYWPRGGAEGLFYSYAYPEPAELGRAPIAPSGASYSNELGEFVLPYEAVRTADEPDKTLLEYLQTTYEAVAAAATWDRNALERQPVDGSARAGIAM
jgi:hypothetical protein